MKVVNTIKINLSCPAPNVIYAKQDDKNTRTVEIELYDNAKQWTIPSGTTFTVTYTKQDGTTGFYSVLTDGATAAASASGNVLTVELVPQVFTAEGNVAVSVAMTNGTSRLSTFSFAINVEKAEVPLEGKSQDYYNMGARTITEAVTITDGAILFGNFVDEVGFGDSFLGAVLTVTSNDNGYKRLFSMMPVGGVQEIHNYFTSSYTIDMASATDVTMVGGQAKWLVDPEQTFVTSNITAELTYWRR